MGNTLKIKVFIKSILFCKYLRNKSLDLREILYGSQLLSCELKYQIIMYFCEIEELKETLLECRTFLRPNGHKSRARNIASPYKT